VGGGVVGSVAAEAEGKELGLVLMMLLLSSNQEEGSASAAAAVGKGSRAVVRLFRSLRRLPIALGVSPE
jgi:hypothetical protein